MFPSAYLPHQLMDICTVSISLQLWVELGDISDGKKERKEKGWEGLFNEIIVGTFSEVEKERDIQMQEAHKSLIGILRKDLPQDTLQLIFSTVKRKERVLKFTWGKPQITFKRSSVSPIAEFSPETPQAKREWKDKMQGLKQNRTVTPEYYSGKFSFANKCLPKQKVIERICHQLCSVTSDFSGWF